MVFNRNIAEDLLQEILIKVWRGIKKYDDKNKFASWLFAIAHNTVYDYLRRNKTGAVEFFESTEIAAGEQPYSNIEYSETEKRIKSLINKLPEKQKEVLLLRMNGEMTFKEIAELRNEPLNSVISHMHYAVNKLKKALREEDAA